MLKDLFGIVFWGMAAIGKLLIYVMGILGAVVLIILFVNAVGMLAGG